MATPATNVARPAQFDRATQHRRSMIAKINIARQQLHMVEDDYRQLLFNATGRTSLRDCSDGQLANMITALKGKGFQPLPTAGPRVGRGKHAAGHPVARKARALWLSLHQLGVVRNPAEEALEEFAKRQLKCETFKWARQSEGFRVIEALKSMGQRAGWMQHNPVTQKPCSVTELQAGLCQAILAKLKVAGVVPQPWSLNDAAFRLCGIELGKHGPVTADQYQRLAGGLGAKLWEARPEGEGQ